MKRIMKKNIKTLTEKFIGSLKLKFRMRQALSLWFIYALVFVPLFSLDGGVQKAEAQVIIDCSQNNPFRIFQRCPLGGTVEETLENQAINDVMQFYGVGDRVGVLRYARNEIRSFLYLRLIELLKKENPTAAEQQAINYFGIQRIRGKRVEAALAAQQEYIRFVNDPCNYQPPTPYTYSPGMACYSVQSSYLVGVPYPTFEEFQQFGAVVAYGDLITPEAQNMTKKTTEGIITGTGALAVGIGVVGGISLGSAITFSSIIITSIFPFAYASAAGTTGAAAAASVAGTASGAVGAGAVAGPAAVILAGILCLVMRSLQVQAINELPGKLEGAIYEAQNQTIDVRAMLDTETGNQEVYGAFLLSTLPDFPDTQIPPPTSDDRIFITSNPNGSNTQQVPSFDYLGAGGVCHSARLSGGFFVDRNLVTNAESVTLGLTLLDPIFLEKIVSRKGGQFVITDVINNTKSQLSDFIPYRTCAAPGASQVRHAQIRFDNIELSTKDTLPVGCPIQNGNGVDLENIGKVYFTNDPPQTLGILVNGQTSATVNGITLRNVSINSGYIISANVLTDQPAPTSADFTISVTNSIGQTVSRVVKVKKTAIIDNLDDRRNHRGAVGESFDLPLADESGIIVNCASYNYSVSGQLPPGTTFQAPFGGIVRISGTPTSGGLYTFNVNKNYANGEVFTRNYTIFVQSEFAELQPDLVSWWRGEKDAEDVTGRNKGAILGRTAFTRGKVGDGFKFNGQNAYVGLPSTTFNPANDFSLELWFKTATRGVILGRQNGVEPYDTPQFGATPAIYIDQNGKLRVQMFLDPNNTFTTSQTRVDDNGFHHVAVTFQRDTGTRTVYLDGVSIGTVNSPQFTSANNKYQFGTGYINDGIVGGLTGWFNFNGIIDEPTLHSRVLSSANIAEIFRAGGAGKLRVDVRAFPPSQHNGTDGGIHLRGIGGLNYLYYSIDGGANFQNNGNFTGLAPGTYNVVVKDSAERRKLLTVVVPNPPPSLSLTTQIVNPQCNGAQTGEIRIFPTGITGGAQFSVLNGANVQNSNVFTGLNGGTYTPWIRDVASGTTYAAEPFVLTEPAPITVAPSAFPNANVGASYSQTFTVGGGTAPYHASVGGTNSANGFALPDGLNATVFGNTVTISGTPTTGGTFPIKFSITDNNTCFQSATIPLTIISAANVAIGGKVSNGGQGLPNATVTLSGGTNATATTDANGNYIFNNLPSNQNYTVSLNLNGYTFTQTSISLNSVNANVSNADFTTAFVHYEGDIAGRSTGDGAVDVLDFISLRRIRANLEPRPANGGEWQRASIAPRSQLGSVFLGQNDENQMLDYILGIDPLTLVGGPSIPSGGLADELKLVQIKSNESTASIAPAQINAVNATASNGAVSVPLVLNSDGNTTAVQFTVTYDATKLTLASVTTATQDNAVARNTSTPGKVSVLAYRVLGGMIGFPPNTELLRLNFTVNQGATGTTPIAFTDTPTAPLAADPQGNAVVLNNSPATVTLTGPTAANVTVSGRVLTTDGRGLTNAIVTMTDASGNVRSYRTGSFGYFNFDEVEAGQTYVFSVNSKLYTFAPQILPINDDVSDLIFTAQ
jgi:Concanavalin A-like lectin/glucanases superfamily/Cohesin domain/Carboxypeptidase regulatory-like domain